MAGPGILIRTDKQELSEEEQRAAVRKALSAAQGDDLSDEEALDSGVVRSSSEMETAIRERLDALTPEVIGEKIDTYLSKPSNVQRMEELGVSAEELIPNKADVVDLIRNALDKELSSSFAEDNASPRDMDEVDFERSVRMIDKIIEVQVDGMVENYANSRMDFFNTLSNQPASDSTVQMQWMDKATQLLVDQFSALKETNPDQYEKMKAAYSGSEDYKRVFDIVDSVEAAEAVMGEPAPDAGGGLKP